MLRVYGPGGPDDFEDIDANGCQEQPAGGLLLTRTEVRTVRDPGNLAAPPRHELSNPQLVCLIAAGHWVRIENVELDQEETPAELAFAGGVN